MNGTLHGSDRNFAGVSIDTRTLGPGELFFALAGPNYDGSEFVSQAAEKSAAAAVLPAATDVDLPHITVDDTRLALGMLAAARRKRMPAKVIGITGSNGKTTLREMIASCLSLSAATLATRGNLNNEIGLPLTLLSLSQEHRYAVIEMGANHPGEIAYLTSLAEPEVVAITNVAPAHLEGFGDLDGVARAKGEILGGQVAPVFAVLNADDSYFSYWSSLLPDDRVISFGIEADASVFATDIQAHGDEMTFSLHIHQEEIPIRLPLAGLHNVKNACAAAAVLHGLGIDSKQIRQGLEAVQALSGRLHPVEGITGLTVYDDSYNANPQSVIAAAEFLVAQSGQKWLVLGDMGELGEDEVLLHKAVGRAARRLGIDRLLATGVLSQNTVKTFGSGGQWYEDLDGLIEEIQRSATEDTNILIKGSRFMQMERVVEALINAPPMRRKA
ncbi:MAG: UDP-N-acetylmuramoyl-tripeptide--D-alanyl-D-alanine ligase [Proteobacteria bacterium]|nr:UDP-N-acetylmuramoyl-tripeptide--D-alanyl-D-alanine ligase [Pseudomonadota bacterium]